MASPLDPSVPPSIHIEVADDTILATFDVRGAFPPAMSGRVLGAHGGVVHSVHLRSGHVLSYRSRRIPLNAGAHLAAGDLFAFGGSILSFTRGSLAEELSSDLAASRPVDLAGQSRALSACPKYDPISGDLHLLATARDGAQAHVVVTSGALTRHSRPLLDAPNDVADLAITRDHIVFACDGFIGVTSREREARITWIVTGVAAPVLVHAHDVADAVVVHALTPSLEQWTLHIGASTVHCRIGASQPGDLAFVADDSRPGDADAGWLVGFVHEGSSDWTDLVVLDAADISRPIVAAVRIPRRTPEGLHITWIPDTNHSPQQGDGP